MAKVRTYTFDDSPCWVVTTQIPEPKRKQGVKQILVGDEPKTTPLILYNKKDVLKFITVERDGAALQVRQMLGGIAIVDKPTLIVALKSLKAWEAGIQEPEIAFHSSEEKAIANMDFLREKQERYFEGLLDDLKNRVKPLNLSVMDFNDYLLECLAVYGEGKSVSQLLRESAKAQAQVKEKEAKSKKGFFGRKT